MNKKQGLGIFFLLASLVFPANANPGEIHGKIISVIDGNTIEFVGVENDTFKLVLNGIDCPELGQAFGDVAKTYLEKLVVGKEAVVVIEGKDRFGNKIGSVRLNKGRDPRLELLEQGLAWTSEKNPNPQFETIKEMAKSAGKGLWQQQNPEAPWIFRRQQTMLAPKSN